MFTRRDTLGMLAAVGGLATASGTRAAPPAFDMPAGACDCHTHVFPDPRLFPFAPDRRYTPPVATADELLALQRALRLDRVVIVAPSVYGADMRPTIDGMRKLGARRARGVSVYSPNTSEAEMDRLHDAGMRGMRVNIDTIGVTDPAAIRTMLATANAQAGRKGWHVQIYARLDLIERMRSAIEAIEVPIVFDHFAGADGRLGARQPGFDFLETLLRAGKAHVKLSALYRAAPGDGPDYPSLAPIARRMIAANPDRLLWGTDWPHPGGPGPVDYRAEQIRQPYPVDDGHILDLLARWVPDGATRRKILTDNPARLYDFG